MPVPVPLPLHYAATDALVALAGAWGAWRLTRPAQFRPAQSRPDQFRPRHSSAVQSRPGQSRAIQWAGAAGVALFGLAGAIGTVRIAAGLDDQLAALHRLASQTGGLAGLVLILVQIRLIQLRAVQIRAGNAALPAERHIALIVMTAVALSLLLPAAGAILFVTGLIAGAALLWRGTGPGQRHLAAALGFALMLPNVLLVRASPHLSADAAWHAYHLLVAAWLCIIPWALQAKPAATAPHPL